MNPKIADGLLKKNKQTTEDINLSFDQYIINNMYCKILYGTDDIDFPKDYENFVNKRKNENNE